MESSMTLMSAHIQFLDTQLALIHIPLHLYSNFVQAIFQLLLPDESQHNVPFSNGAVQPRSTGSWVYDHPFINISVTPIECSIACSRSLATQLFVPAKNSLDAASRAQVSITHEDYVVMQVDGEGLDAGQRVLELTSPLAMAGISIFFITTYFSDYILVPLSSRSRVIHALEERGFQFEHSTSTYYNPSHPSHGTAPHTRNNSTSSTPPPPGTPPPTTVSELQTRTFATLKRRNVVPAVDESIRLVLCAGRKDNAAPSSDGFGGLSGRGALNRNSSASTSAEDRLHLGLIRSLITPPYPRFLSLTLTDTEPASLLLHESLLPHFPGDTLLGSKDDVLIPITLDLRDLPMESTGIVCGIAGRLVGGTSSGIERSVEMSYLSTARAGTVMVSEDELDRALGALRGGQENGVQQNGTT